MAESNEEESFSFSPEDLKNFKKDLLATVFNQTHMQLSIYQRGKCLRTSKAIKSRKPAKIDTIIDKEEPTPSADILNDIQLDKELDALRNIYKVAYEELRTDDLEQKDSHKNLQEAIKSLKENNNEMENLTKQVQENKKILQQLKELQKTEEEEMSKQLEKQSERMKELREQLSNIKRINRLELRLVEKWEKNRQTQATVVGEKEERHLMQEILELHRRLSGEQRIIYEIESFRNNEISELKEKIAHWEEKFKADKSEITEKNLILSQNIADVIKSHEKHRQVMEQRQQFVAEYKHQKAEEQRLYEEQRYRIECAIRIQAWWRGVMVRRGLGPYRKKPKKGKKSKGKK